MKQFGTYQWVEGEPMTERDKQEVGSRFWNEGKWTNYILPFLPPNCQDMIFIDMGCNAGIFLKLAKDIGFSRVIGVEANKEAFQRALNYRERIGYDYELRRQYMQRCIDDLPVSDYMVFANAHYYFAADEWIEFLDKAQSKTRNCIIVTAEKRPMLCKASADVDEIRNYFKLWKEVGFIDSVPMEGDPFPRKLYGLCFESPFIERVPIDSLDCGNNVQRNFYKQLDEGKDPFETRYLKIITKYRKRKWPPNRLRKWTLDKVELYNNIKKNGLLKPLIVAKNNRIADGNHRYMMLKHLGYKSVLIRKV